MCRAGRGETGRIRLGFAGATYFQPIVLSADRARHRPRLSRTFSRRGSVAGAKQHATPPRRSEVPAILPMVAAGFGVSIVPASIGQIRSDGAVYLNLEGAAARRQQPCLPARRSFGRGAELRGAGAALRRQRRAKRVIMRRLLAARRPLSQNPREIY
jgi:hypothetical protein